MRNRIISIFLVTMMAGTLFTGCAQSDDSTEATITDSSTEEVEPLDLSKFIPNLEEGGYYVIHNNVPEKVYMGYATFPYGEQCSISYIDNSDTSTDRVMWFSSDFENIPTFCEGDTLIYYSTSELTEQINFERFEDMGYTIGLCKLVQSTSGRYKISTDPEYYGIYPGSDAEAIYSFPQENVILEKVGGVDIREQNISRAGTVKGMKEGKNFECEIYGGTEMTKMVLRSDYRAMGSMQYYISEDFEFLSSNVIKINIPEWFNSGYYCLDGLGMFRYVKGSKYNPKLAMNIPNKMPEEDDSLVEDTETEQTTQQEKNKFTYEIQENELGKHTLCVTLLPGEEEVDGVYPKVTLILDTPDGKSFKESESDDGTILLDYEATCTGEYKVTLSNTYGRAFEYNDEKSDTGKKDTITNVNDSKSDADSEEEPSES